MHGLYKAYICSIHYTNTDAQHVQVHLFLSLCVLLAAYMLLTIITAIDVHVYASEY